MFSAFYVMKVSKELFKLGWTPKSLPSSMDPGFRQVIVGLKHNGVEAEDAARLLDGALQGDHDCLRAVTSTSGMYGMMYFGTEQQWTENSDRFLKKPPK